MGDKTIASESGHWYRLDGTPCYEIMSKTPGKMRPTTLADARKLNLVPSVTTITKILDKPALGVWLQKQVLMAALTLTRLPDETDDAWIARIMEDSKAQGIAAAARGTAVHTAIERHIQGKVVEPEYFNHVNAVEIELEKISVPIRYGKSEHSFAHVDGFGGKVDLHSDGWLVDFKTKDKIDDDKRLAWDEHVCQLAAYAYGLGLVAPRCINVFVGVQDCRVVCVEHDAVAIGRGLRMFQLMLSLWREKNGIQ